MSVNDRLARMEEKQDQADKKLTAIFDLLNPLKTQVDTHGESIRWITRLGTIGLGMSVLLSAWAALIRK